MLCFDFSSIFNLFSPWRDNNSYGYYTKVSDSTGDLTFNYGDVFDEYTNADANIACSSTSEGGRTCYVGCTCKSGWNGKKTISSSGSNLTTSGAGADLSGSYTIADSGSAAKTTASTSGLNISTMATGDSCTISVTDPRYGVTCTQPSTYDCAGVCGGSAYFKCTSGSTSSSCSSGYYSVYLGKQKCTSGSATNSTSCYTCKQCTYTCPTSGYSINTTSCGSGYTLKTESATKVNSSCPDKKCGKCEQNYYTVTFKKVFNSSCDGTGAASGYSGINGAKVGSTNVSDSSNTATVSNVVSGTSWSWTPGDGTDTTDYTISLVSVTDNGSGTITGNKTISATYKCEEKGSDGGSCPDGSYFEKPDCDSIKGNDWYSAVKSGNCWSCVLKTCHEYFGCSENIVNCANDQTLIQKTAPWGNEQCCGECQYTGGGSCPSGYYPYSSGYCPRSTTSALTKCCQCPTYEVVSATHDPSTSKITISLMASHQFPVNVIRLVYYKVNGVAVSNPMYVTFSGNSSSTTATGTATYSSSTQATVEVTSITAGDTVCSDSVW